MKAAFMESNEPMLERFELWAKTLSDYVNSKEFKQPLKIDKGKLFKWLPESEVNSNAIMRSYPKLTPSGEKYVPYTLCPAITEAKERPFPSFMYRTFLLNIYEYKFIENLFEHVNYLLPRFMPKQFQLPDDVIAFINTGASLFNYIAKNEFSDQTIEIYFKDNNNNFHHFDLILPSDRKFSHISYGVSSISASRLPFVVCTMTKDDPCFTTPDGKYVTGSDGKAVPKITRMKEAKFIIEEKDHIKKIIISKGHTFRTNEEIKQAYPDTFTKRLTSFEEDVRIQIYRLKEQNTYWLKRTTKNIPEFISKDIRKEIETIEKQKRESLPVIHETAVLLGKSKNDNILNLIIRAIQNKIIKADDAVNNSLIKLLGIKSRAEEYDQQDSDKSSFEIIKGAIRNCKIQTTFNGFKKLVSRSLKKQSRLAHINEQKQKLEKSVRLHPKKAIPPSWLNQWEASGYYKIPKTTFYREIEKNKNDSTKVNYPHKQLSKEYCEDLSERLKIRNDKIKDNKNIAAIAKHFKVAESTVQKKLPYYRKRYTKAIIQEKDLSIQEKNKIPAIIHPPRERATIRHLLKH